MSTKSKPALTELAEQVQTVRAELEKVLASAQPLLHRHLELLEAYVDVSEELFVDICEKDGYLAFAEELGKLQNIARELDARAFVGRDTSSRDLLTRPLLNSCDRPETELFAGPAAEEGDRDGRRRLESGLRR